MHFPTCPGLFLDDVTARFCSGGPLTSTPWLPCTVRQPRPCVLREADPVVSLLLEEMRNAQASWGDPPSFLSARGGPGPVLVRGTHSQLRTTFLMGVVLTLML